MYFTLYTIKKIYKRERLYDIEYIRTFNTLNTWRKIWLITIENGEGRRKDLLV